LAKNRLHASLRVAQFPVRNRKLRESLFTLVIRGSWFILSSEMLAEMTALFERLLAELPPGTATLNVYAVPRNGGTVIELRPTNPAAADFGVHCDDRNVFSFSFGVLPTWEFPYERRYAGGFWLRRNKFTPHAGGEFHDGGKPLSKCHAYTPNYSSRACSTPAKAVRTCWDS